MTVYLARKGYHYSPATIHKYMNAELGLRSIVRPQKTDYEQGKPHKVFENKLQQNFMSDKINQKWCTDFTYLFLKNHDVRYNCSIIDLHDRSVIASITDRHITSDLAIRTLQKALDSQPAIKGELILHSDQGSQCKFCSNGTPILKLAVHSFWFSGTRFLLKTVRFSFIIVM